MMPLERDYKNADQTNSMKLEPLAPILSKNICCFIFQFGENMGNEPCDVASKRVNALSDKVLNLQGVAEGFENQDTAFRESDSM